MSIKKTILISFLVLIIILGGVIFAIKTSYKKQQKEIPERGKIIYFKVFKNGIDPKTSLKEYQKIFQEIQGLVNLPVKYPTNLPEGYKLFKISVWQEEMESEGIEIYFDKNYQSLLKENAKYIEGKKTLSEHGFVGFNEEKSTILLKETFVKPVYFFYTPEEFTKKISLENNKKSILIKYTEIDESNNREIKFANNLYLGYALKNQKKYYYIISSNISEKEIINFANSIIENEKNE
jgi:hypothetical protein